MDSNFRKRLAARFTKLSSDELQEAREHYRQSLARLLAMNVKSSVHHKFLNWSLANLIAVEEEMERRRKGHDEGNSSEIHER